MKTAALQQALEALEHELLQGPLIQECHDAMAVIKAALAQLWVELSDDDIDRVTDAQWAKSHDKPIYAAHRAYARAIEAAIKERNQ